MIHVRAGAGKNTSTAMGVNRQGERQGDPASLEVIVQFCE